MAPFDTAESNNVTFLIENWTLILVAVAAAGFLAWPGLAPGAGGLTPQAAVQLMNHQKAILVDVCEPAEYAAGHVTGARNVPLGQLEKQLGTVAKNKALPLVLVCQSGARSARAVAIAKKLGYDNAQSLAGGLAAWRSADLPVQKG